MEKPEVVSMTEVEKTATESAMTQENLCPTSETEDHHAPLALDHHPSEPCGSLEENQSNGTEGKAPSTTTVECTDEHHHPDAESTQQDPTLAQQLDVVNQAEIANTFNNLSIVWCNFLDVFQHMVCQPYDSSRWAPDVRTKVEIQTVALNSQLWCTERADGRRSEEFCPNAKAAVLELKRSTAEKAANEGKTIDPIVDAYFEAAIGVLDGEDPKFPARERPVRKFNKKALDSDAHQLLVHNHNHAQQRRQVMQNPHEALQRTDFMARFAHLGRSATYVFDIGAAPLFTRAMKSAEDDHALYQQLTNIAFVASNQCWPLQRLDFEVQQAVNTTVARQEHANTY